MEHACRANHLDTVDESFVHDAWWTTMRHPRRHWIHESIKTVLIFEEKQSKLPHVTQHYESTSYQTPVSDKTNVLVDTGVSGVERQTVSLSLGHRNLVCATHGILHVHAWEKVWVINGKAAFKMVVKVNPALAKAHTASWRGPDKTWERFMQACTGSAWFVCDTGHWILHRKSLQQIHGGLHPPKNKLH